MGRKWVSTGVLMISTRIGGSPGHGRRRRGWAWRPWSRRGRWRPSRSAPSASRVRTASATWAGSFCGVGRAQGQTGVGGGQQVAALELVDQLRHDQLRDAETRHGEQGVGAAVGDHRVGLVEEAVERRRRDDGDVGRDGAELVDELLLHGHHRVGLGQVAEGLDDAAEHREPAERDGLAAHGHADPRLVAPFAQPTGHRAGAVERDVADRRTGRRARHEQLRRGRVEQQIGLGEGRPRCRAARTCPGAGPRRWPASDGSSGRRPSGARPPGSCARRRSGSATQSKISEITRSGLNGGRLPGTWAPCSGCAAPTPGSRSWSSSG